MRRRAIIAGVVLAAAAVALLVAADRFAAGWDTWEAVPLGDAGAWRP